jgi:iron(III) transport system permease protein
LKSLARSFNIWIIYAVAIVILIATPILTILYNIFQGPGETWSHLAETVLWSYISNSVLLLIGVGLVSLILGISTAWLVSTTKFPGRKIFEWALILPLSVPTYIIAYTYAGILDYTGPVQVFLRNQVGINLTGGLIDIMNIQGAIFVMSFVLYPYIYVIARASFTSQSRTILESSRVLGGTAFSTFFKIALPVSRPAIVGGLTLVLMEVLNDYGAVKYYGVQTFTIGIFRAWFSIGDINAAIYLSALLVAFVFGLITLERMQRGKAKFDSGSSINKPIRKFQLTGIKGLLALLVCLVPLLFGFIIPLFQLISWSFQTASYVVNSDFLVLIGNSFMLAILASGLCVIVALVLIYSVKLNKHWIIRSISKIAVLGYAIPGAVIAVGVMIPVLIVDKNLAVFLEGITGQRVGLLIGGTLGALLFAYLVRFLAVAYNPVDSGFKKVCSCIDEASRSLGSSPFSTLIKINVPIIKGTLFSGALLVFVDVLKELPLTLILRPFNFNTLATKAFELASDEMLAESANAALIIIATGIIPIILLSRLISNKN